LFDMVAAGRYRDVRFNIETKLNPLEPETTLAPEPFVRAVLAPIRKARLQSRTTIQSFDWRTLEVIQRLAPKLQTVALTDQQAGDDTIELGKPGASPWLGGLDVDDFAGSVPRTVQASGARVWSPNYLDLDAALVAEAHALGLAVVPWTVNEPADMERVLGFGVDGMISDRPDLLRALLQKKGIAVPAAAKPP
jgi:glycerophosphoryl diester phosphodiesterase